MTKNKKAVDLAQVDGCVCIMH